MNLKINKCPDNRQKNKSIQADAPHTEKVKERQGIVVHILNFATVISAIAFVISLIAVIYAFREANRSYISEDTFAYRMSDENYYQMVSMAYEKEAEGSVTPQSMSEYIAAAKYFEACSYYEAFTAAGDEERAAQSALDMEEALSAMGELSVFAEDIRQSLEK